MYIWLYWENQKDQVMPPYIELCHATIRHHCSDDFKVVLTTPATIRDYIPDAGPFEEIRNPNPAIRAAYIRVALLAEHGGIWMDSDIIVLKNFVYMKELIEKYGFVGFNKNSAGDNHVPNWMMMARSDSKVIQEYKRRIDMAIAKYKTFGWGVLGARMITPIIRKWANPKDYTMLQESLVSPVPWQQYEVLFDESLVPEDVLDEHTMAFMLFNKNYSRQFKAMPREKILNSSILMTKLFRQALEI